MEAVAFILAEICWCTVSARISQVDNLEFMELISKRSRIKRCIPAMLYGEQYPTKYQSAACGLPET